MAAVFELPVKVRWRDVDALGHVNHAVFLTYLEEGRDAFYIQALGSDPSYVVVRLEVDLRAEVRYEDQRVTVRIAADRLGTTSLTSPVAQDPVQSIGNLLDGNHDQKIQVAELRQADNGRQQTPLV